LEMRYPHHRMTRGPCQTQICCHHYYHLCQSSTTHDSKSGMPCYLIVASIVAVWTGLVFGQLDGDSGAVCVVASVGSLGPNLPHDFVDVSSAPVRVPPSSAESSPSFHIATQGTRIQHCEGWLLDMPMRACHRQWWCSIWRWWEVWEYSWFLRWPLVGNFPPPFFVMKKGIDHGEIAMIRGCRFELCTDGIGCSE
jgi:hypothetical protein